MVALWATKLAMFSLKFTAFGSKKLAQKTVKMGCLLVK